MSIPHGLLALLRSGPMYGYQLRAEFERATAATWPLNIGQVYTTLTRLERDGLVLPQATDDEGRQRYELTASGREAVGAWFARPITLEDRPRDELAIKLALAALAPEAGAAGTAHDVRRVVQTQRTATMQRLQELTRSKRDRGEPGDAGASDLAWSLVLDNLRFMAEAELRWLDHCEGALSRAARAAPARGEHPSDPPDSAPTSAAPATERTP